MFFDNNLDKSATYVHCEKNKMTIYKDDQNSKVYKVGANWVDFISADFSDYDSDFHAFLEKMFSLILDRHGNEIVYNEVLAFINKHASLTPYMNCLIVPQKITAHDFYFNFAEFVDILSIRRHYEDLVAICYDADNKTLAGLPASSRYFYYIKSRKEPVKILSSIKKTVVVLPEKINMQFYSSFFKQFEGTAKDLLLAKEYGTFYEPQDDKDLVGKFFLSNEIEYKELYRVDSINDIIELELYLMLNLNYRIRICPNCNNFFILENKHEAQYCKRKPGKGKQTCQQIAASNRHYDNRSTVALIRKKYYDTYYNRKKAKIITESAFRDYKKFAKAQALSCEKGKLSIEDFESLLKTYNFFKKK